MPRKSAFGYFFSGGVNSILILKEGPGKEIKLISLTDWSWVLLISTLILVVWLLIILQSRSKGAHEFGMDADSDDHSHLTDHGDEHEGPEINESEH